MSCGCSDLGSIKQSCTQKGDCTCLPGVTGQTCDNCKDNYFNLTLTGCTPCDCDLDGVLENKCDFTKGECRCKQHMSGRRCDKCKVAQAGPGYFNKDLSNWGGCQECYCHGHGLSCEENRDYYKRYITGTASSEWTFRFKNDVMKEMPANEPIVAKWGDHISIKVLKEARIYMSTEFSGDLTHAFGRRLNMSLIVIGGANTSVHTTSEDIILEGMLPDGTIGRAMANVAIGNPDFYKEIGRLTDVTIPLSFYLESYTANSWSFENRPFEDGNNDFFRKILSNVTSISIRPFYRNAEAILTVTVTDVVLETAGKFGMPGVTSDMATWVEKCQCRPEYEGDFCERCAPGNTRSADGQCVPCECNNHATGLDNVVQCDGETGECNCQHNTAGTRCSQCENGFYRDSWLGTPDDCKPCPCPPVPGKEYVCHKNETTSVVCENCPEGRTGNLCGTCKEGLYHDHPDYSLDNNNTHSCIDCECNDNVKMDAIFICNSMTGVCTGCQHNTKGDHCEMCKEDYYGDANTSQKCRACDCSPVGSLLRPSGRPTQCDASGQCECQPNVGGMQCSNCSHAHFGFESGKGCEQCNCDPIGSRSLTCDSQGKCECYPNVVGDKCNQCMPEFTALVQGAGCSSCECSPDGASSPVCHNMTGVCPCKEGVIGVKCDKCEENFYISDGAKPCLKCDDCYNLVQKQIGKTRNVLNTIDEKVTNLTTGALQGDPSKQVLDKLEEVKSIVSSAAEFVGDKEGGIPNFDEYKQNYTDSMAEYTETRDEAARLVETFEAWFDHSDTLTLWQRDMDDQYAKIQMDVKLLNVKFQEYKDAVELEAKSTEKLEKLSTEAIKIHADLQNISKSIKAGKIALQNNINAEVNRLTQIGKLKKRLKGDMADLESRANMINETLLVQDAKRNAAQAKILYLTKEHNNMSTTFKDLPVITAEMVKVLVDQHAIVSNSTIRNQERHDKLLLSSFTARRSVTNAVSTASQVIADAQSQIEETSSRLAEVKVLQGQARQLKDRSEKAIMAARAALDEIDQFDQNVQEGKTEVIKLYEELVDRKAQLAKINDAVQKHNTTLLQQKQRLSAELLEVKSALTEAQALELSLKNEENGRSQLSDTAEMLLKTTAQIAISNSELEVLLEGDNGAVERLERSKAETQEIADKTMQLSGARQDINDTSVLNIKRLNKLKQDITSGITDSQRDELQKIKVDYDTLKTDWEVEKENVIQMQSELKRQRFQLQDKASQLEQRRKAGQAELKRLRLVYERVNTKQCFKPSSQAS